VNWLKTENTALIKLKNIPCLACTDFRTAIIEQYKRKRRVAGFFGVPEKKVYAVLADDTKGELFIASADFKKEKEYQALTPDIPAFHMFERELFEQTGIKPLGHPWLKPLRYERDHVNRKKQMKNYPFYTMPDEEVHEVAVGPVHAGIIEPGHFRFMCNGEKVYHLEIQLGYQHRGVENLFLCNDRFLPHLAESIAGDTVIGHTMVYTRAMEIMAGVRSTEKAELIRDILLEMERIAVHIGDLGAISNDIAYLLGNSVFGATRTLIINMIQDICGNRFGKGLIRVGGVLFDIKKNERDEIRKILQKVEKKVKDMCDIMFSSPSVLSRLEKTGIVNKETASRIGLTGMSARASGISRDIRTDFPDAIYKKIPVKKVILNEGDVYARTYIRFLEILESMRFINKALNKLNNDPVMKEVKYNLSRESMVISMAEGWRGEIIHIVLTDKNGKIKKYKIKDPSFNNWYGLALAERNNGISDFPLCNKSFNLSYCGNDL